jgi:serine/threonine-protein kinase
MPISPSPGLDDTLGSALASHLDALGQAWKQRAVGQPAPRWQDYLPPTGRCPALFLLGLLSADVLGRIRAGKDALLAEPYFEDSRLFEAAGAEVDRLLEVLVRREYHARWRCGQRAHLSEYLDRFPHLQDHLDDVVPTLDCPFCGTEDVPLADEEAEGTDCPQCGCWLTPAVAAHTQPDAASTASPQPMRLGRYELGEEIAHGGMGKVFLAHDPALNRDLAVKLLKPELHDRPELVSRFVAEAQITAQLPHPGIVPVHELGQDETGLPFLAMKLVRGQTLEQLLAQRSSPAEDLPRFVAIFEQVCQAVAFAHSRRVIHRDLKPANIMVGRFGEVQVMDWGLAKALGDAPAEEKTETPDPTTCVIRILCSELAGVVGSGTPRGATAAGTVLGTPAYMPPEQANGQVHLLDERCDVFGLGAILCEILTGQPPYVAEEDWRIVYMAALGTLNETFRRLDHCGAQEELVALVKECLSADSAKRPRDAGVVAERVAAYQRGVQQRLRQAEQERATAQTRLVEERKRRRLGILLAAVVLLLLVAGGSGAWMLQRERARQHEAGQKALAAVERARSLLDQGWHANDLTLLNEAKVEADRATEIAHSGAAAREVQEEAALVQQEVQGRRGRAEKDRTLLEDLLNVPAAQETRSYLNDASGWAVALSPARIEEHFAAAFRRRWHDLDLDRVTAADVAERLRDEPEPVVEEILAGLDAWMIERRARRPGADWQHLFRVAERLDRDAHRRQLRALLAGEQPPPLGLLAAPAGVSQPWTALWELEHGARLRRLVELRRQMNPARDPVSSVVLLARVCWAQGDATGAERVLRQAVTARPNAVLLLDALARLLEQRGRLAEAIEYYRVARALRPHSGVALGMALSKAGRAEEAEAVLRDLADMQPDNAKKDPELSIHLGVALAAQNKPAEAEAAYRSAIAIQLDAQKESIDLGNTLREHNRPAEAEAAYRKAAALQRDLAVAHCHLGNALRDQNRHEEAEAAYREAIRRKPDLVEAHNNLGLALRDQKKLAEAVAVYREADHLFPEHPLIRGNLRRAEHLLAPHQ